MATEKMYKTNLMIGLAEMCLYGLNSNVNIIRIKNQSFKSQVAQDFPDILNIVLIFESDTAIAVNKQGFN